MASADARARAVLCVLALASLLSLCQADSFSEELIVRPLRGGKVSYEFSFVTRWDLLSNHSTAHSSRGDHVVLFPKQLAQMITEFELQELHLTFTRGRWFEDDWGAPPVHSPGGAEVYAWFGIAGVMSLDDSWRFTTASLSSLLCASLSSAGKQNHSSMPRDLFLPSSPSTDPSTFRYGVLPSEAVCTENLAPWLHLLPCRTERGLAKLLQPLAIYAGLYFSVGTHLRPTKGAPFGSSYELVQDLIVVFEAERIQKGAGCAGTTYGTILSRRFHKLQATSCAAASRSQLSAVLSSPWIAHSTVKPPRPPGTDAARPTWQLQPSSPMDLNITWALAPAGPIPLLVSRRLAGKDQHRGHLLSSLVNRGPRPLQVRVHEWYPSFMRLYLHTLQLHLNVTALPTAPLFAANSLRLLPSDGRTDTSLQLQYELPPFSTLSWSVHFGKAILHWTQYPPDVNRGFDVPPSIVLYRAAAEPWERLYAEAMLLMLPFPDFSMPYNVIMLTCTAICFYFGTMVKGVTRRFTPLRLGQQLVSQRPVPRLLRAIGRLLQLDKEDEEEEEKTREANAKEQAPARTPAGGSGVAPSDDSKLTAESS